MKNTEDTYLPYEGNRISLQDAVSQGGGPVAGKWCDRGLMYDSSLGLSLSGILGCDPSDGDWISGVLGDSDSGWILANARIHSPGKPALPVSDISATNLADRSRTLKLRADILFQIRSFFRECDFLEVETPVRVSCPAVEPYLDAISVQEGFFLATSPELHLKRMLAAGYERIFEIARVFRSEEHSPLHLCEFSMLEWYRTWTGLSDIMTDCEELITFLSLKTGKTPPKKPFPRITYRETFERYTGLDPANPDINELRRSADRLGVVCSQSDGADDILAGIFAGCVEPKLGEIGAVFITDFPASSAVLARIRSDPVFPVAERFELYLDGVELANAFHELTDPDEHRKRISQWQSKRQQLGRQAYPVDEKFLKALDSGMPPASGIALGIDRLVMWLLEIQEIQSVVAFPDDQA